MSLIVLNVCLGISPGYIYYARLYTIYSTGKRVLLHVWYAIDTGIQY